MSTITNTGVNARTTTVVGSPQESPEFIASNLWDTCLLNYELAFNQYLQHLEKSPLRREGLRVFQKYYRTHWDKLTLGMLGDMIALFVDQEEFQADYNRIDARIANIINQGQHMGGGAQSMGDIPHYMTDVEYGHAVHSWEI